jgi:uncharacterized protein YutE (UPF0331/DUF86 family)
MADAVILSKIVSLKRCVDRIKSKIPADRDILLRDWDIQDIIALNLERAVQICTDIAAHITADTGVRPPSTMAEAFDRLHEAGVISGQTAERMKKSVGFRNIAVHEYQSIDWTVVYFIITRHLSDFQVYAKEILEWTGNRVSETQPSEAIL